MAAKFLLILMRCQAPTIAAIRDLFDVFVNRHVVMLNPARSVRGGRHSVVEGKIPEMTLQHVANLLKTIDTCHVVGLRDYVIIAALAYTAARVGAVARLKRSSLRDGDSDSSLRFSEKGGKQRLIPVRHDLKHYLSLYLDAADLWDAPKTFPLFRSAIRREKRLTKRGLTGHSIARMFRRRLNDADMPDYLSPHGIRGGSATDLLSQRYRSKTSNIYWATPIREPPGSIMRSGWLC